MTNPFVSPSFDGYLWSQESFYIKIGGMLQAPPNIVGVKTGKNTEGIKPKIQYVCDTSKSFIHYTTRDGEDKSNTPMSRDTKRSNKNP